jgi:hypothetical protein
MPNYFVSLFGPQHFRSEVVLEEDQFTRKRQHGRRHRGPDAVKGEG